MLLFYGTHDGKCGELASVFKRLCSVKVVKCKPLAASIGFRAVANQGDASTVSPATSARQCHKAVSGMHGAA